MKAADSKDEFVVEDTGGDLLLGPSHLANDSPLVIWNRVFLTVVNRTFSKTSKSKYGLRSLFEGNAETRSLLYQFFHLNKFPILNIIFITVFQYIVL